MFQPYKPNLLPPILVTLGLIAFGATFMVLFLFVFNSNGFEWWKMILAMVEIVACSILGVAFTYNYAFKLRKKYFDQTFAAMGLEGKRYLSNSVQYHGKADGYGVHVYLQPTQRNYPIALPGNHDLNLTFYTGDRLEIFIDHPFKTRMVVSSREYKPTTVFDKFTMKPVFNFLKKVATPKDFKEIKVAGADYKDYVISGVHEQWTKDVLSDARASKFVKDLLNTEERMGIKALAVLPEAVKFHVVIALEKITPDVMKKMFADLLGFVKVVSKNEIKTDLAEESDNERLIRVDRNKFYHKYRFRIAAVLFVLLGLPAIGMGLLFWWVIASNTP